MPTIKSRQVFSGTMLSSDMVFSITINPVVMEKTYVVIQTTDGGTTEAVTFLTQELTSTTNVKLVRTSPGQTIDYEIQVIEFESGVAVQRGETQLPLITTEVTISSVDRTKAFSECRLKGLGITTIDLTLTKNLIVADTTLRFGSPVNDNTRIAVWQVVEIDDAVVAQYDSWVTNTLGGQDITISTINMSKSFLSISFGLIDTGLKEEHFKYGRIETTTNVKIWAYTPASMYYQFYTITIPNISAQRGLGHIPNTAISVNATLSRIDVNKSFSHITGQCGDICPTDTFDSYHEDYAITTKLTSNTNLYLKKGAVYAASIIPWEVVEFTTAIITNKGFFTPRKYW